MEHNPEGMSDREVLERILELQEENNKHLRSIHRQGRISLFFRIFYWAFLIGTSIGLYYYFGPKLQQFLNAYQELVKKVGTAQGMNTQMMDAFFNSAKAFLPK